MDYKEHLLETFGETKTNSLLESLKKEPTKSFRLTHKANESISFPNLKKHPIINNAFYTNDKLGNTPYHHTGSIYIQDASAMLVSYILPIAKNDLILDLCAAPGGKSTMAAEKNTDGILISNDISYNRAKILSQNIERLGFKNVIVTNNNIEDFNHLQGCFDKIILDAPCSGEGMFRKNELAELDWNINKVYSCAAIQKELIIKAYNLLKKDGVMVYSTCTFSKEENENIIKYLLDNTNASLIKIDEFPNISRGIDQVESIRILPDEFESEGHFIALIKCNDSHNCSFIFKPNSSISNEPFFTIKKFFDDNLNISIKKDNIVLKNDIYYLIDNNIDFKLKVIRNGLELGRMLNKRFIPSHALAMSLKENEVKNTYELNDNEVDKYLHGETIESQIEKGYVLLTYKHISIGFGKATNGTIKNLYPKGLRI